MTLRERWHKVSEESPPLYQVVIVLHDDPETNKRRLAFVEYDGIAFHAGDKFESVPATYWRELPPGPGEDPEAEAVAAAHQALLIVKDLLRDMNDRSGFDFGSLDKATQEEWRRTWEDIVAKHLKKTTEEAAEGRSE